MRNTAVTDDLWFDRLDMDAARRFRPTASEHRRVAWPLVFAAVAMQNVARPALSAFLVAGSVPTITRAVRDPISIRESWSYYDEVALRSDPGELFRPPPRPEVEVTAAGRGLFNPFGGDSVHVTYPSSFVPHNPALADVYMADVRNQTVHGTWYRHSDGPRPTFIGIHGFQAGSAIINTEYFDTRWLYSHGWDVFLVQLPFHGARAAGIEGWNYLSLDVGRMSEAVAHSISDIRAAVQWLRSTGAPTVGVGGVSLGGLLAALLAAVETGIDFAIPIAPAVSLIDTLNDAVCFGPVAGLLRSQLHLELDDFRRVTAPVTPLSFPVLLPPDRLMIVGATRDDLTRPYQQHLLWQQWGEPEMFWHFGSHQIHLHRGAYRERLERFLRRTNG